MGKVSYKTETNKIDSSIRNFEGTVLNGNFIPYKKTYKEMAIARINLLLNIILSVLILFSVVSYYFVTSSEMHLNKIRKETLMINDENMELQNKLDYLKSYRNVDQTMQNNNILQKAEEIVEVSVPVKDNTADKSNFIIKKINLSNTKAKQHKFKWSLGY